MSEFKAVPDAPGWWVMRTQGRYIKTEKVYIAPDGLPWTLGAVLWACIEPIPAIDWYGPLPEPKEEA